MTRKKKTKPADVTNEKGSWSNPNYEHVISEVEALRAILQKMRENDESDKKEEHGNE